MNHLARIAERDVPGYDFDELILACDTFSVPHDEEFWGSWEWETREDELRDQLIKIMTLAGERK